MVDANPEKIEASAHGEEAERKVDYFWPFKMERADAWMIALTAIIAFTGVAGFIILRGQMIVMQGQLDEMRSSSEDTKRMIKAAEDSAKTAQDAVELTRQNAQRQLRAYLFHSQPSILINGTRWTIEIKVRNVGQTPAQNTHDEIGIFIENEPKRMRVRILPIQEPVGSPIMFIARDIDFTLFAKLELSVAKLETNELLNDSDTDILINIMTRYSDIFKNEHHIRTQFRCTHGADEKWDCTTGSDGNEAD